MCKARISFKIEQRWDTRLRSEAVVTISNTDFYEYQTFPGEKTKTANTWHLGPHSADCGLKKSHSITMQPFERPAEGMQRWSAEYSPEPCCVAYRHIRIGLSWTRESGNAEGYGSEFYFNHIARHNLVVSVITAFCDSQGSPPSFEPTEPHVTRNINFNFITTTRLSSDMAKSLDCVNLELIFGWGVRRHYVEMREVLNWLKHWENIVYMDELDYCLAQYSLADTPHEMQSDELQYLNGVSPLLLDIIQAYTLFEFEEVEYYHLRYICWVLNISWQEMLASIATARRYAGEDLNIGTLKLIVNADKLYRIRDSHRDATLEVLATERFLLILAKSPLVLQFTRSWGCVVRSCPHTESLLDALRSFVMDILETLSVVKIGTVWEEIYEADWIKWRERNGFLQPI
ncbi:hypothetical protein R3P38DRAFT_2767056 [Favolaschia claudopus]|uniref:Uncharacterized protein n=1 Tax=Favolaschia claudopus TaxID=2862362 RepID=A0AAW0CUC7_9AGAR